MIYEKLLFLFFFLLPASFLFAQQKTVVAGKVTDKTNQGLPGVTIIEKGTSMVQ